MRDRLHARKLASMLGDDEALEGVEAWLRTQEQKVGLGPRNVGLEADVCTESPAGWLLRLVRLAREARQRPRGREE